MSLEINRPCYEVDFTSKSVSEQLKADDVLLQNQRLNSATKKANQRKRKIWSHQLKPHFKVVSPTLILSLTTPKLILPKTTQQSKPKNKHKIARILKLKFKND